MRNLKISLLGRLALALLLLLAAGCSSPTTAAAPIPTAPTAAPLPSGGVIKLGALLPLNTPQGQESKNGLEYAVNEINKAGGILTLKGTKIELVVADSGGSPETAAAETTRLIQTEGVSGLISADLSPAALASAAQARKLAVPLILTAASADALTPAGQSGVFRLSPSASQQAQTLARFFKTIFTNAGLETAQAALLLDAANPGELDAESMKSALAAEGIQVTLSIQTGAALQEAVTQIQSAGVDLVVYQGSPQQLKDFAAASAAAGLSAPVLINLPPSADPAALLQAEPAANAWFTSGQFSPLLNLLPSLTVRYKGQYNQSFSDASLYAYQAGWLVASALENAGNLPGISLQTALASMRLESEVRLLLPQDLLTFDEQGQNTAAPVFIFQIQGGAPVLVWPADYGAKPILTDR